MHSHARTSAEIDDNLLLRPSVFPLMSFSGNRAVKFSKKNKFLATLRFRTEDNEEN